jgi:DNA-binding response OmpR family regulator
LLSLPNVASELPELIAEDDAEIRRLLCAALEHFGYVCETAATGEETIRKLETKQYSLLLLDLMMPRVDGTGVIDYIRFSGKQVPVVVMTAAGRSRIENLSPLRVKAVLSKPFEMTHLIEVVTSLVRGDQADS